MVPVLGPDVAEVSGRVVEAGHGYAAGFGYFRDQPARHPDVAGVVSWSRSPRARLSAVGERRLAPAGTALLSAGVLGGLYLLYRLMGGPGVFEGSGGSGGGGGR